MTVLSTGSLRVVPEIVPKRSSDEEAWSKQLMWRESHGYFVAGIGFKTNLLLLMEIFSHMH